MPTAIFTSWNAFLTSFLWGTDEAYGTKPPCSKLLTWRHHLQHYSDHGIKEQALPPEKMDRFQPCSISQLCLLPLQVRADFSILVIQISKEGRTKHTNHTQPCLSFHFQECKGIRSCLTVTGRRRTFPLQRFPSTVILASNTTKQPP